MKKEKRESIMSDNSIIEVSHICKEFVSAKKYPGLKGAFKGLISKEKTHKKAVDDISFSIG